MNRIYNLNLHSFVVSLLGVGFLLIVSACQDASEKVISLPISRSSPTSSIPPTFTPTLTPSPPPILDKTGQPTPTVAKIITLTPTAIPVDNSGSSAESFEHLLSGGIADVRLFPRVAEIMLTDATGRRIGYDPTDGEVNDFFDEETNFSVYLHNSDRDYNQIFMLPMQAWGTTITITITGVDAGEYTLFTIFGDGRDVTNYFYTGTVTAGQVWTKTIDIPTTITGFPSPPEVHAGLDVLSSVGQMVTFSGSFIDINPDDTHQIAWEFGDGSGIDNTLTPTHTYSSPGIYTVTLTVSDSIGFTITDTLQVTVK